MSFGSLEDWHIREAEALPILKHAFDRGLTTWDTVRQLISADRSCQTNNPLGRCLLIGRIGAYCWQGSDAV